MSNAIEITNLNKAFDNFSIHNVSFVLPSGYIMGLVGKNGAGKTTTIKLLLELLQKDSGTTTILGKDVHDNHDIKQDIAVVFDEVFLVEDWKISDVEGAISPFYTNWDTTIFHDYLQKFQLLHNKKVKELSKGMKMKLMLAIAMSHKARLLILDEPTSGLDPVARDEFLDILRQYIEDEQHSVLFSTHITTDLEKIADFITIMNEGQIFYSGTKDDLIEKYCIVKGGLEDLTSEIEKHLIGIQKSIVNFCALIDIQEMKYCTSDMVIEQASIDDILIHLNVGKGELL